MILFQELENLRLSEKYMAMNLKDYRVQPDEGLFEQIEKRLKVRRMVRVGGVVAVVCVVMVGVMVAVLGSWAAEEPQTVVAQVAEMPANVEMQPAASPSETKKPEANLGDAAGRISTDGTIVATAVETQPAASPSETKKPDANLGDEACRVSTEGTIVATAVETRPAASPSETKKPDANLGDAACRVSTDGTIAATAVEAQTAASPENVADKADPPTPPVHIDNLIWAPNVIVPNGDVDENRVFSVKITSTVTDFHVYIYNRGGRQVFMSTDPDFKWDGTYDGSAMPQGAYVWVAKFRDSSGRARQEKGTVTLLR